MIHRFCHIISCGKLGTRKRGTILIVVLWVSMGLVSVALYFGHSMMLEYRAADNLVAGLEAEQAIEGALRYAKMLIENLEDPGQLPDLDDYEAEQAPVGESYFWFLGRGEVTETQKTPVFSLMDEGSKLNLNTATQEMLEALPNMTAELAAAIIDWRDEDEDLTSGGAESQTYLLNVPPYSCKNASFETVEELRMVQGCDWDTLFGEDANRNGVLDPNEDDGDDSFPDDNRDGILDPGLLEYVTVYSREPNTRADGSARINLNADDNRELESLLSQTLGESRAQQILQALRGGPGQVRFGSELDFYARSGMTSDEFSQVADALTVTEDEFIEGRINVNTASETVLACIPGIGEDLAAQLVAYREGKTDELDTIAWVTPVLDEASAVEAGPFFTARS
jgi:DNA uptake protein ComE-like DNA-binding protein